MTTNETRAFPIDTSALQGRHVPKDQPIPEIPGYMIEGVLGAGGMAVVYLATQKALHRPVALKVLSERLANTDEYRTRFLNEARMVARLRHPQIISVYDSGEANGVLYIASDYMDGGTLKDRIRQGMTREQAVEVVIKLAQGLAAAHEQKIYHRDMKPDNVLYDSKGHIAIADFGIAKIADPDISGNTTTGTALGTPSYMSPEQFAGGKIDGRSDIYSLGVMFYQMLTGQLPFVTNDPYQMALAHTTKPFPALPPQFASLEPMLRKMTAKDPRDRFKNAELLAEEAKTWLESRTGGGPTLPVRKRTASAIVLVLALIAAAGGWLARDLPWQTASEEAPTASEPGAMAEPPHGNESSGSTVEDPSSSEPTIRSNPDAEPSTAAPAPDNSASTQQGLATPIQRQARLQDLFRDGRLAAWSSEIDLYLSAAPDDPVAVRHSGIRALLTEQNVSLTDGAEIAPSAIDAVGQRLVADAKASQNRTDLAPGKTAADLYRAALTLRDDESVRAALNSMLADRIAAAEAARNAENWSAVVRIANRALAIDPENEQMLQLLEEAQSKQP